jgi:predicted DNA-binding protein
MRIDRVLRSSHSVAHIARHEVTPEEVEDVLFNPPLDAMTKKYPSEGEIKRLAERYEQLSDEDVLAEWERGEPVTIDVDEPMVSRSVRFPRHTMDRLHEVARMRGVGVTQLIREWTEERLEAGGDLNDRALLADELERAARLLRERA